MTTEQGATDANAPQPQSLEVVFVKAPLARSIHVDGVWGGITPQGLVVAAFFTEYRTYPAKVTYKVEAGGRTVEQGRTESGGITRQVEAEVFMDLEHARSFRDWLSGKIEQIENIQAARAPQESGVNES